MNTLHYKGFDGMVELDMERRVCRGKLLFIDDLVTYEAASLNDIEAEFQAAVDDYIETCRQIGKVPQKPHRGLFQVRTSPELHRAAARYAVEQSVTLNEAVNRAMAAFFAPAQEAERHTTEKVVEGTAEVKTVQVVAASHSTWREVAHHAQHVH